MKKQKRVKRPKRLTRAQKECLSAHCYKADNWLLLEETDFYLKIVNKTSGKMRRLDKFIKKKSR